MARRAAFADLRGSYVNVDAFPRVKSSLTGNCGDTSLGTVSTDISSLTSVVTSLSTANLTLSSALSVLTADGASPTQAHVTTATGAFATVNTGISSTLSSAAVATTDVATPLASGNHDLVISWDTTKFTKFNQLHASVKSALQAAAGDASLGT